jgi:hypothetical protein
MCLACSGHDARTPRVRGTYSDVADYLALDIVTKNGGSFIARDDKPGPCPGEGWQCLTMPGKRGAAGDKGERGEKGPKGETGEKGTPAPTIVRWELDRERYALRAVMSDASETPPLDLRALFEQFENETR